jgi:GH18 family chitinase
MRQGLLFLFLSLALLAKGESDQVIGYLPHYRSSAIVTLPYPLLTDLIFFSVEPRTDGSIDSSDAKPATLRKLKTLAKPEGVKVHLCVGGWGKSKGFSKMAADPVTRLSFVGNLTAFLKKHELDGADVDWEHPRSKAEIENYQKLLVELKKAFAPHGFKLSIAVAGWGTYLKPETIPFVDRILVMAYDQGTPHASFSGAESDMEHWVKRGVPKSKLILGLPFFGRNAKKKSMTYDEIVRRFKPSPDSDQAGGYHFNGPATIRKKTDYARKEGFGGVMIWELGQDAKGKNSLLHAIGKKKGELSVGN